MYNYVDIGIVIIFFVMIVDGYLKGLVRSIIGLIGYVAAIIIAKFYYLTAADILVNQFSWFSDLKTGIADSIVSSFNSNAQLSSVLSSSSQSDISVLLKNQAILDQLNLPESITGSITNLASSVDVSSTQQSAVETFAEFISNGVINGISFMLVVILVIAGVKVVGMILDAATEVPIIKQANKLGGVVFGVLKAIAFIFVVMTLITFISPMTSDMQIMETINASTIGVYFYNNNILLILLDLYLS